MKHPRSFRLVILLAVAGLLCLVGWMLIPAHRPPETVLLKMKEAAETGRLTDVLTYANEFTRASGDYERFRPTEAEEHIIGPHAASWGRQPHFGPADLAFLKRMQLYRSCAARLTADTDRPADKAEAVFTWVMDHVAVDTDTPTADRCPADCLLDGRGTSAQIAWTCVALLESAGLPAALVEAGAGAVTGSDTGGGRRMRLGTLAGSHIRLYDPTAGTPVETAPRPHTPSSAADTRPAAARPPRERTIWLAYEPEQLITRMRVLVVDLAGPIAGVGQVSRDYVADYRRWMHALTGAPAAGAGSSRMQVTVWLYPFDIHGRTVRTGGERRDSTVLRLDELRRQALMTGPAGAAEVAPGLTALIDRGGLADDDREAARIFLAQARMDAGRMDAGRRDLAAYLADHPTGRWRNHALLLDARAAERQRKRDEALAGYAAVTGPRAARARWLRRRLLDRPVTPPPPTRPAASP